MIYILENRLYKLVYIISKEKRYYISIIFINNDIIQLKLLIT